MRTTVAVLASVLFAVVVIACGQSPKPQTPAETRPPAIALDQQLEERLQLGLPLHVELHQRDRAIGHCTVAYDLWEERYKIAISKTDIVYMPRLEDALRVCIEPAKLQAIDALPAIRVREMPHVYRPRADYPVF